MVCRASAPLAKPFRNLRHGQRAFAPQWTYRLKLFESVDGQSAALIPKQPVGASEEEIASLTASEEVKAFPGSLIPNRNKDNFTATRIPPRHPHPSSQPATRHPPPASQMPSAKTHTLDIRLPEGVVFSLSLAGPATRFAAYLIDLLLVLAIINGLGRVLALLGTLAPDVAAGLQIVLLFAVPILYGILFEGFWRGQTPGKKLLRLRVMDAGGLRLDLKQVVVRNLLRAVDVLPYFYFVGGVSLLCSARAQRLGDLAADTVVVRGEKETVPDLAQLACGKYNTLRDHPVLAARLRQRVPPVEAGLALQALLRRESLEPGARVQVFEQLAARFRVAGPLPATLCEDLTDEQLVRNVVDVLFRTRK